MFIQNVLNYFAHWARLKALCFAVWTAFHPQAAKAPYAPQVAEAIADAVMFDSNLAYTSDEEEVAVAARWAVEESSLRPRAVGDSGVAHGIFQLHSAAGKGTLEQQTQGWLALLHEGARICPESPAAPLSGGCIRARKLADRRTKAALRVLHQFEMDDVSPLDEMSPLETNVPREAPAPLTAQRGQVLPGRGENAGL